MHHNKAGIIYSLGLLAFGLVLIVVGLIYRRRYKSEDKAKSNRTTPN